MDIILVGAREDAHTAAWGIKSEDGGMKEEFEKKERKERILD